MSLSDSPLSHTRRTGVLLVCHGTRSELGKGQCAALAGEIAAALDSNLFSVELAYLEMAEPTIAAGIDRLIRQRVDRLVVVPLLLFAAAHAKQDIPNAVKKALSAAGADVPIMQTEPLGLEEGMIELAAARFREVAERGVPLDETCLLLIGRGSRDEEATVEMWKLGELLHERLGVGQSQVGFLAMAEPTAHELIRTAAGSRFRQIIVQPHLLFHGELLDRLQEMVLAAGRQSSAKWSCSRVLGEQAHSLAKIFMRAYIQIPFGNEQEDR